MNSALNSRLCNMCNKVYNPNKHVSCPNCMTDKKQMNNINEIIKEKKAKYQAEDRCSNCGETLTDCDSSCFYKEQLIIKDVIREKRGKYKIKQIGKMSPKESEAHEYFKTIYNKTVEDRDAYIKDLEDSLKRAVGVLNNRIVPIGNYYGSKSSEVDKALILRNKVLNEVKG